MDAAPTNTACPVHHTATTGGEWDKSVHEKRLPSPMPVATARKMYALYDAGRVEDGKVVKGGCNLPHHEVGADGTPGAANLAGVRNALSRLPQTEGYTDAERADAEKHLQAHLDDAPEDHASLVPGDLMARVWSHLNARDKRPRPALPENRVRRLVVNQAGEDEGEEEEESPDYAEMVLYAEIGYWGATASDVAAALAEIDAPTLHVRLNSPGGDLFDGLAIYNALADHPAEVTVTVDGLAASAASFIAMAGDEIRMNRGSQMMIHDASGLCIGNASDMTEMADVLNRCSDVIAKIYAARAGGRYDSWRKLMRAETWYSAAEAVTAGLADEMAAEKKRPAKPKPDEAEPAMARMAWDLTCFHYAGRAQSPPPVPVALVRTDDGQPDGTPEVEAGPAEPEDAGPQPTPEPPQIDAHAIGEALKGAFA